MAIATVVGSQVPISLLIAKYWLPVTYTCNMGLCPTKLLPIAYWLHLTCTHCLMHNLHSPLGDCDSTGPHLEYLPLNKLSELGLHLKRIRRDGMLCISNSFQNPNICNKKISFLTVLSNSNLPIVLPCMWQIRP